MIFRRCAARGHLARYSIAVGRGREGKNERICVARPAKFSTNLDLAQVARAFFGPMLT
jgi:hypothetical protein